MMYSCAGLSGADEDSRGNLVQWSCLILRDDKCGDGSLPAGAKNLSQWSLLQNSPCRLIFSRLEAKAEDAGGHFWHDMVIETNIITPAK
jgi:hypothetical protein